MFPWKKTLRWTRMEGPFVLEMSLTVQELMQDLDPGWFDSRAATGDMTELA